MLLKAPYDSRRRGWKRRDYWGANPEPIKWYIMNATSKGASGIMPMQAYEGMKLFSGKLVDATWEPPHDLPSDRWKPRQYLEAGRVGLFAVYDWETQDLVQEWEVMQLGSDDPDVGAEMQGAYTGANAIPLEPQEIGIMVSQIAPKKENEKTRWQDAKFEVDLFYGKSSTWFGEGRQAEAKEGRTRYGPGSDDDPGGPGTGVEMLDNADGAILYIYSHFSKKLKEKKQYMQDFNLGSNDMEQNPRLRSLFDRGFFRRPTNQQYKQGSVSRSLALLNDKGHAHAPELLPDMFHGAFRDEVLENPDGPLVLRDHNEWVPPSEGYDVGEEGIDKRPEYVRRAEDDDYYR